MSAKREQVIAQCRVVAALCGYLATISEDYIRLIQTGHLDDLLEMEGARTAAQMEILGDMLNGMDAVDEEDEWMTAVFEEAHRLWPRSVPS